MFNLYLLFNAIVIGMIVVMVFIKNKKIRHYYGYFSTALIVILYLCLAPIGTPKPQVEGGCGMPFMAWGFIQMLRVMAALFFFIPLLLAVHITLCQLVLEINIFRKSKTDKKSQ